MAWRKEGGKTPTDDFTNFRASCDIFFYWERQTEREMKLTRKTWTEKTDQNCHFSTLWPMTLVLCVRGRVVFSLQLQ